MKAKVIMLFAGTTEGRGLCEYLADSKYITHVYVTTEYGGELLPDSQSITVHIGKLTKEAMYTEVRSIQPDIVLDATHPYASLVTDNLRTVCKNENISYIRVLREADNVKECNLYGIAEYVSSMKEAVLRLNEPALLEKNILLTTGSKNIPEYKNIVNYESRVYLRMLPEPDMLSCAIQAGFSMSHIIGMQGPFTEEFNEALIRQLDIGVLVTKESGGNGGYEQKIRAAKKTGIKAVIIKRPVETEGWKLKEVIHFLKENNY